MFSPKTYRLVTMHPLQTDNTSVTDRHLVANGLNLQLNGGRNKRRRWRLPFYAVGEHCDFPTEPSEQ